jgi:hypothetical protein
MACSVTGCGGYVFGFSGNVGIGVSYSRVWDFYIVNLFVRE